MHSSGEISCRVLYMTSLDGAEIENTYFISHQLCWLSSCTNKTTVFHNDRPERDKENKTFHVLALSATSAVLKTKPLLLFC